MMSKLVNVNQMKTATIQEDRAKMRDLNKQNEEQSYQILNLQAEIIGLKEQVCSHSSYLDPKGI